MVTGDDQSCDDQRACRARGRPELDRPLDRSRFGSSAGTTPSFDSTNVRSPTTAGDDPIGASARSPARAGTTRSRSISPP